MKVFVEKIDFFPLISNVFDCFTSPASVFSVNLVGFKAPKKFHFFWKESLKTISLGFITSNI